MYIYVKYVFYLSQVVVGVHAPEKETGKETLPWSSHHYICLAPL